MGVTRNTPDAILNQHMDSLLEVWSCACEKTFDCTSVLLPQCENFLSRIETIHTMTFEQQQILVHEWVTMKDSACLDNLGAIYKLLFIYRTYGWNLPCLFCKW